MAGAGRPTAPDALINREHARRYWQNVKADDNGMLGGLLALDGYRHISRIDLQTSYDFLTKLGIGTRCDLRIVDRVLEGGAGIGRVTKGLLVNVARQVDVIEPVAKFTDALQGKAGIRKVFNVGLEEWQPASDDRYGLIWTQWCVGHLTDEQLVHYFERCKTVLDPKSGVIVVKENVGGGDKDTFDDADSAVTRCELKYLALFKQAGLRIVRSDTQKGFPRDLFPVKMWALKPKPGALRGRVTP